MKKAVVLRELENTKRVHIEQMEKIELLLEGYFITEPTELAKTDCEFGRLFYGNKDDFLPLIGAQFFHKIDLLHEKWHNEYANVYEIFYKVRDQGIFSKLRGTHKIKQVEYDKANMYYSRLNKTTTQLLRMLDISIRRVSSLNDSKFKN